MPAQFKRAPRPHPPVQSDLLSRRSERLFTQYRPGDLAEDTVTLPCIMCLHLSLLGALEGLCMQIERKETIDQYPLLPFVSQEESYTGWLTYCKARWRRQRFERRQRLGAKVRSAVPVIAAVRIGCNLQTRAPVAESLDDNDDDELPADSPEVELLASPTMPRVFGLCRFWLV